MNKMMKVGCVALAFAVPQGAAAQDWTGFYAGLGLSTSSGEDHQINSGVETFLFDLSGEQTNLFIGYNVQAGNWVYGGELAASEGKVGSVGYDPSNFYLGRTFDLKGRVGYAAGRALWFGSLGWVSTDKYYGGLVTNEPVKASGFSFGLGVDYMVGERMFVGGEVTRRDTKIDEGELGGYPATSAKHTVDTFALRLGIRF